VILISLNACTKSEFGELNSTEPGTTKQSVKSTYAKRSGYYVANYVSPDNVGEHHTNCIRFVFDYLKSVSDNQKILNDSIRNGIVVDLMQEYCKLNSLEYPTLPELDIPEDYIAYINSNGFSSEANNIIKKSFEVVDDYSTTDSMITALNDLKNSANNLTDTNERTAAVISINVLKSSIDVWIDKNYKSVLPNKNIIASRLTPNEKKVLRKDAVVTVYTTIFGGGTPLSFVVGMISGTGASIGVWMSQNGYDDSWWPF